MKTLIIAEKPSVAKDIAAALSSALIFKIPASVESAGLVCWRNGLWILPTPSVIAAAAAKAVCERLETFTDRCSTKTNQARTRGWKRYVFKHVAFPNQPVILPFRGIDKSYSASRLAEVIIAKLSFNYQGRTMKNKLTPRSPSHLLVRLFVAGGLCAPFSSAFALTAGLGTLSVVVAWMTGLGILICTIAILWAAFRVMFQGARINDVAPVFIGSILAGSAAVIAGMLMGS